MITESRLLRAARPTVTIDGEPEAALTAALLEAEVRERLEGLASCELRIGNWQGEEGYPYFDRALLDFGSAIEVRYGTTPIFSGRISALRGVFPEDEAPQLVVCAEDRLQDLRMTRRSRSFTDSSVAEVLRSIAGEHSLQADVQLDGPTRPVLSQLNESDLAFLRRLLRDVDGELWVEEDRLLVRGRSDRPGAELPLAYLGNLHAFHVGADLAGQRSSLRVCGWDRASKEAILHEADEAAISSELGDGESGASLLQSAFGARSEQVVHSVSLTSAEAEAEAEARFRAQARRFVCAHGVTEPDAGLRVGARVSISRVGPMFGGVYYVTGVCHRFDGVRGTVTHFDCERPWVGR